MTIPLRSTRNQRSSRAKGRHIGRQGFNVPHPRIAVPGEGCRIAVSDADFGDAKRGTWDASPLEFWGCFGKSGKNGTSPAIVTVKVIGHVSDVENLMKESWTFVTTMEA